MTGPQSVNRGAGAGDLESDTRFIAAIKRLESFHGG